MNYCKGCGKELHEKAEMCTSCGVRQLSESTNKSRITAAILALFLGGFGAHKFYMGKVGLGILYMFLFWTFIPAIVALVEGIIYLTESDAKFAKRIICE